MASKEKNEPPKAKASPKKLVFFALGVFCLMFVVSAVSEIGPFWFTRFFPPTYEKDFNRGRNLFWTDQTTARQIIDKSIKDAEADHADIKVQLMMHRDYARFLYYANKLKAGDEQIDKLIALCPGRLPNTSPEAGLLAQGYAMRGWEHHKDFLSHPEHPSGVQDCEKALETIRTYYPKNNSNVNDHIATLAAVYADIHETEKADALIKQALATMGTQPGAWNFYSKNARIKAVEHDYKAAIQSYLKARSCAGSDLDRYDIRTDFTEGVKAGHESLPELKQITAMFHQSKFAELDALSESLRQKQTEIFDGTWILDAFYERLVDTERSHSEEYYGHEFSQLKKWNEQTKSVAARVALAKCYIGYAWHARGNGYADSVSEQGWKLFAQRIEQARTTLDADPAIKRKCPRACSEYSTVALAQNWGKADFQRLLDETHKAWPKYMTIDNCASYHFLPRWHGEDGDSEKYITARADAIKGPAGDKRYAQMVIYIMKYLDHPLASGSTLKWKRAKAGFKQIIKEFPHSPGARIEYFDAASAADDNEAVAGAFDGYTP
jgi:hypothetical protein